MSAWRPQGRHSGHNQGRYVSVRAACAAGMGRAAEPSSQIGKSSGAAGRRLKHVLEFSLQAQPIRPMPQVGMVDLQMRVGVILVGGEHFDFVPVASNAVPSSSTVGEP